MSRIAFTASQDTIPADRLGVKFDGVPFAVPGILFSLSLSFSSYNVNRPERPEREKRVSCSQVRRRIAMLTQPFSYCDDLIPV